MKTRDQQAQEYSQERYDIANALSKQAEIVKYESRKAFIAGWEAALENRWHDARKEMPEVNKWVLAKETCSNKVQLGRMTDDGRYTWQLISGCVSYSCYDLDIACWMEIPEIKLEMR